MYVIVLDEGYLQIDAEFPGNDKFPGIYNIEEYTHGIAVKVKIKGKNRKVKIIPIGQIYLNHFNRLWDEYIKSGGKGNEQNNHGHIMLSSPSAPFWQYDETPIVDHELNDIDYENDLQYSKCAFAFINGDLRPIFSVNTINELYRFDLMRTKKARLKLRQCEHCGNAFFAKTTAVRCDSCRRKGIGNKKKYNNLMSDPARKLFKNIKDRNSKGNRKDYIYSTYYANLCYIIESYKNADNKNDLLEYAKTLNALDNQYYKLCKFFENDYTGNKDYTGGEDLLYNKWLSEREEFPKTDNPEEWINHWLDLSGIDNKN